MTELDLGELRRRCAIRAKHDPGTSRIDNGDVILDLLDVLNAKVQEIERLRTALDRLAVFVPQPGRTAGVLIDMQNIARVALIDDGEAGGPTGRCPVRFRHRPLEVEARQVPTTYRGAATVAEWCHGEVIRDDCPGRRPAFIVIQTLMERNVKVYPGDWVIQDADGDFSMLSDNDFGRAYEPISDKAKAESSATSAAGTQRKAPAQCAEEGEGFGAVSTERDAYLRGERDA